ncbi:class I SAM-dependent RNA methyltransferase, partial [Tessaracoccus lubricantis]
ATGFWQVHPAAAETLTRAVLDGLRPEPGERAMDLYCGVGLFAGALAGAGCMVLGVEAGRGAVELARHNVPEGEFLALPVERADRKMPSWADLIVLDPPRKGAGAAVVRAVAAREPRAIAYVACDPAALARDLRTFAEAGYEPVSIRGFDLFPMTHHIECVAILHPAS